MEYTYGNAGSPNSIQVDKIKYILQRPIIYFFCSCSKVGGEKKGVQRHPVLKFAGKYNGAKLFWESVQSWS